MKGEIGIAWKEELKELIPPINPSNYYVIQLYERCNALLRRLNEQEQIIITLLK